MFRVREVPIRLKIPGRLVYSAHNYAKDVRAKNYLEFLTQIDLEWGYILQPNTSYTAPVWLGKNLNAYVLCQWHITLVCNFP